MTAYALLATANQGAAEAERQLPMPPWAFGVLALGFFALLLLVLWSFRSIGVHHGEKR